MRLFWQAVTIEPVLICYVTARAMCDPMFKNLELDKACYVNAQFNGTVCSTITNGTFEQSNFTEENNIIQLYITNMHSWETSSASIITMVIVLLFGTCSDHYRIRKPFLLLSLFGQTIEFIGCLLCVAFMNQWPLEVLGVTQEIVLAFFGGEKLFLAIIFAYITDVTSDKQRTTKIAIIQGMYNIFFGCGQSFTGTFLHTIGYMGILAIGSSLCVFGFFYGIFFMSDSSAYLTEEAVKVQKERRHTFDPKQFLDTLKLFKKYKKTQTFNIIKLLAVLSIIGIITYGEQSVMFLFTETAYKWTIRQYTYFFTITTVINTIGLIFAVPLFTEVFKMHDLLIIATAFCNRILVNIIYITIRSATGLYIGCSIAILRILVLVGVRSQLTKYVHHYDVCKVLALYTIVDSCSEGFASALYNKVIYEKTNATFPHAFFIVGICLSVVGITIVLYMYFSLRRRLKNADDDVVYNNDRKSSIDIQITHL
ncbi:hypothetical protein FQR65_LT09321 [Abscondita terminalis]|nr:hypothetical protein FQR65_LT09321 [Abscondita terminalis]